MTLPTYEDVLMAAERLSGVAKNTPLEYNQRLSHFFNCHIYLKREDLQVVRSYKLRGAYNFMSQLSVADRKKGVVCASAGNHAQGVALACSLLGIRGVIFMPKPTPKQKLFRVQHFGGNCIEVKLAGDTFDEASALAGDYCKKHKSVFVHPFNDAQVIAGQGTAILEVLKQSPKTVDYLVVPVGGGGLISGASVVIGKLSPSTQIVGVEPAGAACMQAAFAANRPVELPSVDKFVDGAAVKKAGDLTFRITKKHVQKLLTVEENQVCESMLALYQSDGIIAEPAGALSVTALEQLKNKIKNKTVVCVVSGGNNDVSRYSEIIERALIYRGLKHYFIIQFAQRPGALRTFLDKVLGPGDDIALFEYIKKNNRESGPALIGVELNNKNDLSGLLKRMKQQGFAYQHLLPDSQMFRFLI